MSSGERSIYKVSQAELLMEIVSSMGEAVRNRGGFSGSAETGRRTRAVFRMEHLEDVYHERFGISGIQVLQDLIKFGSMPLGADGRPVTNLEGDK